MSFDYDKLRKKHESGEQWTSYSDLFMVLSVVFLLLYVVASLRTGTSTIMQKMRLEEQKKRAEQAETQLKTYNNLKENYLEKEASDKEQETYEQLMAKLELLQEENKDEASRLRMRALENERKHMALNKYQQIIKNIIDANVIAKTRIKRKDIKIDKASDIIDKQSEAINLKDDEIIERDDIISDREQEIRNLDQVIVTKKQIIAKRDQEIREKQELLKRKQTEIKKLNQDIDSKTAEIKRNKHKINKINKDLKNEMVKLKREKQRRKISTAAYKKKMAAIKRKSKAEIAKLDKKNRQIRTKLKSVNTTLEKAEKSLVNANQKIKQQEAQKAKLDRELASVQEQKNALNEELQQVQTEVAETKAELEKTRKEFSKQVADLEGQKSSLEAQRNKLSKQKNLLASQKKKLAQINSKLKNVNSKLDKERSQLQDVTQKLSAETQRLNAEKERLAQSNADLDAQRKALESKASQLSKDKAKLSAEKAKLAEDKFKLAKTNARLDEIRGKLEGKTKMLAKDKARLQAEANKLEKEKSALKDKTASLSKDLKKAQAIIEAKKKIARTVSSNLRKAGINAGVDEGTGEVVLSFGESFFDAGSARLKPKMIQALRKFMPVYADSIFKDPKTAKKIKSVDIVGFASPTYKGRYVNPNSLKRQDQAALRYNTDLSIKRAKSVFNYIIDTTKLSYPRQQDIQKLLQVSGRSYFSGSLEGRAPAKEMSARDFCKKYDCKKNQKVIIKFELE